MRGSMAPRSAVWLRETRDQLVMGRDPGCTPVHPVRLTITVIDCEHRVGGCQDTRRCHYHRGGAVRPRYKIVGGPAPSSGAKALRGRWNVTRNKLYTPLGTSPLNEVRTWTSWPRASIVTVPRAPSH